MYMIENIGELYGMTTQLFVLVACPKCHSLSISTMSVAESILIFGCVLCAEFESSDMLTVPINTTIAGAEEVTCP